MSKRAGQMGNSLATTAGKYEETEALIVSFL